MTETIDGANRELLLLCDHASAHVPDDIDLGIDPRLLSLHIAVDIGAGAVTRALAATLDAPAILGTVSRLVVDLHREPDHAGLMPTLSDGHAIPGNHGVDPADRVARFHAPYHATIAHQVHTRHPELIVAVHSFTPCLEQNGTDRPWEVGILYNRDERAARLAIPALQQRGVVTGDNEPYSGRVLNMTLNVHAEANDIPSIAVEIRNDLIRDAAGVAKWAAVLGQVIADIHAGLASPAP